METIYVKVLEDLTAVDQFGNYVDIPLHAARKARREGQALRRFDGKKVQWRLAPMAEFDALAQSAQIAVDIDDDYSGNVQAFLSDCYKWKPENLVIREINWKYLLRSVLRGKNTLVTGPSGGGKTLTAMAVGDVFSARPFFEFNLGAMSDPQVGLIGNTHFSPEKGTFTTPSYFIQAITTPNAIVLLDELSRAHPTAHNILMPVLDPNQRYLRIDEDINTPTIRVAKGVTFLATANIGAEYTATRVLDRALVDRFVILENEPLNQEEEEEVLRINYPNLESSMVKSIAEIAVNTRQNVISDDPKISTIVSTRMSVEIAGLVCDGFSLAEAAEVAIYPFYSDAGGSDSERTYMKQTVQMYTGERGAPQFTPMNPPDPTL